jgi:hypothetical protein
LFDSVNDNVRKPCISLKSRDFCSAILLKHPKALKNNEYTKSSTFLQLKISAWAAFWFKKEDM